jgi:hypothetical protein
VSEEFAAEMMFQIVDSVLNGEVDAEENCESFLICRIADLRT